MIELSAKLLKDWINSGKAEKELKKAAITGKDCIKTLEDLRKRTSENLDKPCTI